MPPVLRLAGALNFRDLGGLPTADGRRVRPGLLFRSEKLSGLTDEDVAALGGLGLRTVVDLRSGHERKLHPSRLPERDRPAVLELDVMADPVTSGRSLLALLVEQPTPAGARQMMLATYGAFPAVFAPYLAALFDRLLDDDGLPMLMHCTAGKDRTGFLSALLLAALGAERATIEADYLATEAQADRAVLHAATAQAMRRFVGADPDPALIDALCDSDPVYLGASFDAIESGWGGVPPYLAASGIDADRLRRFRDAALQA